MIEVVASNPCTATGHISILIGNLSFNLLIISWITEPVGEVIIPSLEGKVREFFFVF